jgi:hypothetical protein
MPNYENAKPKEPMWQQTITIQQTEDNRFVRIIYVAINGDKKVCYIQNEELEKLISPALYEYIVAGE